MRVAFVQIEMNPSSHPSGNNHLWIEDSLIASDQTINPLSTTTNQWFANGIYGFVDEWLKMVYELWAFNSFIISLFRHISDRSIARWILLFVCKMATFEFNWYGQLAAVWKITKICLGKLHGGWLCWRKCCFLKWLHGFWCIITQSIHTHGQTVPETK